MRPAVDTIIVGAGLAGACAALYLGQTQSVCVLDAARPAAGASGAAAGLANPLMARKARPVWQIDTALAALHATLALADAPALFRGPGLLRPAADAKQAGFFREAAHAHPRHADWLAPGAVAERYPAVAAPHGGLWVKTGGAVDVPGFVAAMMARAEALGVVVRVGCRVIGWAEASDHAAVTLASGETLTAGRVLLALGADFADFPALAGLSLHGVKGQVVRVARPAGMGAVPHLAGRGYVVSGVASGDETLLVGTSYEHDFTDRRPSPEVSRRLLARAATMLPALTDAPICDAVAGVRVTLPSRLPILGPLPGHRRVWIFSGLGSKGLLMAPLLARALPHYFETPDDIPTEVAVHRLVT